MMKKLLAALMALSMLFCAAAFAEESAPETVYHLSGLIMEIEENGDLLINTTESGDVLVHVSAQTTLNGVTEFAVGQYIYVDFNGVMAMSLPGQITADAITCYYIKGQVVAVAGNNIQLMTENAEYCVVVDPSIDVTFETDEEIELYGQMTENLFAGLPVVEAGFVAAIAPENARQ